MECSVLIPTYNREKTIHRAVQSVLQQTFQDFEIVIVDDGSQDATAEIINEMNDSRIKFVCHPKNLGTAEARNTGVRSSSGKYIAFLDSDDEWLPEKLSHQMEQIHKYREGIIANVSGYFLYDEFNIKRKQIPSQHNTSYKQLLMGCGLGEGTTLIVSREAFEHVGYFDSTLPRYGDWDWLLRFTKYYQLSVTPEPLAIVYRASTPSAKIVETAAIRFLRKHDLEFMNFGFYGKRAIGKRFLEVAIYYYSEGDKKNGRIWFNKAISESIFQRPGMYLRIIDAILGTSIVPNLIRIRSRLSQNRS